MQVGLVLLKHKKLLGSFSPGSLVPGSTVYTYPFVSRSWHLFNL